MKYSKLIQHREEKLLAVWMANKALDNATADPDSEICTISRQFLRLIEQFSSALYLKEEAQKELQ